jgi:hypothetical protein
MELRGLQVMALGSCRALETESGIAAALGHLDGSDAHRLLPESSFEASMLRSLIAR